MRDQGDRETTTTPTPLRNGARNQARKLVRTVQWTSAARQNSPLWIVGGIDCEDLRNHGDREAQQPLTANLYPADTALVHTLTTTIPKYLTPDSPSLPRLTPAKRSIAELLLESLPAREISRCQSCSLRTVRGHLSNMCAKFNFAGADSVRLAMIIHKQRTELGVRCQAWRGDVISQSSAQILIRFPNTN